MKKKNILSNVTMIDRFTQSEKDLVKGGSSKVYNERYRFCGLQGSIRKYRSL